uniref:NADH-ubiquinone oxidoreductase chain 6 n=1 Tax=Mekongiella xizangensis TaxID=868578 RepID=E1ABU7_9ORTH|nr:NADH dehydrogenase subunit 6 [Mekongiella xizangensis]ADK77646.1 NADH dehydrogenase subunit 6 [Mekongiella xizangensis]
MMKMMIMSSSNLMNINFMKMNHPMSIMMTIIIQTLFISMMTGTMMESFWLSYILLLTFLGGMMVLFIYITSIASNELFNFNSNNMFTNITTVMIMFTIISSNEYLMMTDIFKNKDTDMMKLSIDILEMSPSLTKLYNYPSFLITLMMMIYLFLALLVMVKITNINQGPIRKLN